MTGSDFDYAYCERPDDDVLARATALEWLILDADGVLTDGTIDTGPHGEDRKAFHVHDGKGLAMLRGAGLGVAIVTARRSEPVAVRAQELGVHELRQGIDDKGLELDNLASAYGTTTATMGYVGDDIVDLGAFGRAGLAVAVADAHPRLAARSHWVTGRPGGRGAVREVCELLLAARGVLTSTFERHE